MSTIREQGQNFQSALQDTFLTPEQTLQNIEILRNVPSMAMQPSQDIDPALMDRLPELKKQAEMEALKAYNDAMRRYLEDAGAQ